MSNSNPIHIGIIGLSNGIYMGGSWAGAAHHPYLTTSPYYKITALQNSSIESAKAAASTFGLNDVACYGDPESIAKDPDVDLVAVSVKVPEHYKLIEPALCAGKDVFSEWPLAANLADAEALTKLAAEMKVKTMVGLQGRQSPAVRKAKEMIAAGELGDILGSSMSGTWMVQGDMIPDFFEYGLDINAGVNMLTVLVGHAIDSFCYVLGEFEAVQAALINNRPQMRLVDGEGKVIKTVEKTIHDRISVVGKLKNGGVGTVVYQTEKSNTGKPFYWEINGTKGSLVLECQDGSIQMIPPTLKFASREPDAELKNVELEDGSAISYNVGRQYDAFAGKENGSFATFEDALIRHRMIDAIYKSDKNGTRESYV
ncbi:NAD(P)-binding protein [Mytilinidion resinicola]|uniref:NAD(P)-binding protein n=1 Tax=Mytilinidion resinicola TaxID=574789 RepID=A0A6A6XZ15_9PEZI|nr:NAD(P)-binding protein [Mytilinidion resinicola]KAF2801650.1 NAD(P)-binding protein [Mytilinidion resinicola]